MNTCPNLEHLEDYVAHRASSQSQRDIDAHLDQCPECRKWIDQARANESMAEDVRLVLDSRTKSFDELDRERRVTSCDILIDGYDILRELQRGGQGVVYQALQRSTHRKVAIKVLLDGPHASEMTRKRFEREIDLVAQLKHPNIISILDSGETAEGRQYYVMEYVRGVPVTRHVLDEKLSLAEALRTFVNVCEGVQCAHQNGIIHRDIKPSNILVDSHGAPKILDFGLAKWTAAPLSTLVSMSQAVVGTLPYLSPEQAAGNPDKIDTRTDVYALGVVLYEMLTGHYPYPVTGSMPEVLKHIAETIPQRPSRRWQVDSGIRSTRTSKSHCPIDDEIETIALKALSKDVERRYQSAGELGRDIQRYLDGEPIEAKRDSGWYLARVTLRKHKVHAIATVVVLIVTFLFSSVLYAQYRVAANDRAQAEQNLSEATTLISEANSALDGLIESKVWDDDVAGEARSKLSQAMGLIDVAARLAPDLADPNVIVPNLERATAPSELVMKADLLRRNGRYAKALEILDVVLSDDPDDFRARLYRAFVYYDRFRAFHSQEDIHAGLMACSAALQQKDDNASLLNLHSFFLYHNGQLEEAEDAVTRALSIKFKGLYQSNYAITLALQHRLPDALDASLEARRLMEAQASGAITADDNVLRTLATIQLQLGDEAAEATLHDALNIEKKDAKTHVMLAALYLRRPGVQAHEDALHHATRAEWVSERALVYRILAYAELANGLYAQAIEHADIAIAKGEQPAYCHAIKAQAAARLGDRPTARTALEEAERAADLLDFGPDGYIADVRVDMLWFDNESDLIDLLNAARDAIDNPPGERQ